MHTNLEKVIENGWQRAALAKARVNDLDDLRSFVFDSINMQAAIRARQSNSRYFMAGIGCKFRFSVAYFFTLADYLATPTHGKIVGQETVKVDKSLYKIISELQNGKQIIFARNSYKLRDRGLVSKIGTGGIVPRKIFIELEKLGALQFRGTSNRIKYWGYSPNWKNWTIIVEEPLRGKALKTFNKQFEKVIKDAIDSGTTKAQIETSFKKIMSKVL